MTDHKKNQHSSGQEHKEHNKGGSDKNTPNKHTKKEGMPSRQQEMPDPDEEPVTEADPDLGRIQIDDDPEETKKKIPHMKK